MGQAARAAQQLQGLRQAGDQLLRGRLQLQRVGSCGTSGGGGGGGRERERGIGRGGGEGRWGGGRYGQRSHTGTAVTV